MDDSAKRLLQRVVRRIPAQMLKATLAKWERLTAEQRKSIDFTQSKWTITQELVALCEVCLSLISRIKCKIVYL